MEKADVQQLSQRFQQLINARSNLEPAWLSLADHFLPTRYTSINDDRSAQNKDALLNDKIVDCTGIHAMRTLAAGLQGGMTSPARPWFRLGLEDDRLEGSRNVRSFLDDTANRMRNRGCKEFCVNVRKAPLHNRRPYNVHPPAVPYF